MPGELINPDERITVQFSDSIRTSCKESDSTIYRIQTGFDGLLELQHVIDGVVEDLREFYTSARDSFSSNDV